MENARKPQANTILRHLPEEDRSALLERCDLVELPLGEPLEEPDTEVRHAFFLLSGIASRIASMDGMQMEIGIVGREGMTGTPILLRAGQSPHRVFMQMPGSAYRIGAADLRAAMAASPRLEELLLRWVQLVLVHVSQTAITNARDTVEQRLARWLLMYADRLDTPILTTTHDFLSLMLGVHRPAVTHAVHALEGEGLVQAERGRIVLRDRDGLLSIAGYSYGATEREAQRLFGD